MAKYRKLPVVIEAVQWFKLGDHPMVTPHCPMEEGACGQCKRDLLSHGSVKTLEGSHIVCPGDWIITGVAGECYPCKPDIFKRTYEPVESVEAPNAEATHQ